MKKTSNKEKDTIKEGTSKKQKITIGILTILCTIFFGIVLWTWMNLGKAEDLQDYPNSGDKMWTVYGEVTETELIEMMKPAVVKIQADVAGINGEGAKVITGSGVILHMTEEYIDIATASHVVEETAAPLVYFYDGSLGYGTVLAYGKESDVAFVRVETKILPKECIPLLDVVTCEDTDGYEKLAIEQDVICIGSVSQVAGNVVTGTVLEKERFVEMFQNHMLVCRLTADSGMSGCGIFNREGKLIGVLAGTNGSEAVGVSVLDVMAEYRSIE